MDMLDQDTREKHRQLVAIFTSSTSLGENQVHGLADQMLDLFKHWSDTPSTELAPGTLERVRESLAKAGVSVQDVSQDSFAASINDHVMTLCRKVNAQHAELAPVHFDVSDALLNVVTPRPLEYPLDAYWDFEDGPCAATWRDKPHRLIYDLVGALLHMHEHMEKAIGGRPGALRLVKLDPAFKKWTVVIPDDDEFESVAKTENEIANALQVYNFPDHQYVILGSPLDLMAARKLVGELASALYRVDYYRHEANAADDYSMNDTISDLIGRAEKITGKKVSLV